MLATNNLISVSMGLPIGDISYQWNHTLCSLLCLTYFTQHIVFQVNYSFLWLNDILLWILDILLFSQNDFLSSFHLLVSCSAFSSQLSDRALRHLLLDSSLDEVRCIFRPCFSFCTALTSVSTKHSLRDYFIDGLLPN